MLNFYFILFYILLMSIFVYKRVLIDCSRCKRDKWFLFFSMGMMLTLNCLRGINVGNDTISYKNVFEYYKSRETLFTVSDAGLRWMDEYVDIGYRTVNVLFSRISSSYQLFISAIAFFLYGTVTKHIKKESPNLAISVLLFFLIFYHPYVNVLRQVIAISIILLGFGLLKSGKIIRFSLCIIFAALFHKTAVIALLLIPLMKIKHFNTRKTLLVIALVIGLTATNTVKRAVSLLGYRGMYMSEEQGISTYAQILLSMVIFLLINYWRINPIKNFVKGEIINNVAELDRFYSRIPAVHLCLSIAGLNIPILYRCSYYFTIFYLTGIPYFIMKSERSKTNLRVTLALLIIMYTVYHTGVLVFRPEWVTEFQYKFFWQ